LVLAAAVTAPISGWGVVAPLGTARGFGPAKLSVDGRKSWLPIGARSFPILDGAEVRSAGGGAVLDLTDGSRLDVFPFSAIRFETSGPAAKISLLLGRVRFHLADQSRVEVLTPSARLEPASPGLLVGEVFVSRSGLMGLKMTAGQLQVTAPGRVLLAGREPVFLPKAPTARGFYFTSDTPAAIPRDSRAIFGPNGRSVGYLTDGDNFVIQPGFTADLTRPFPSRLVRVAMAKIPPPDVANDAMPLFDLGGHSVGYVSGPMFYAQNLGESAAQPPATQVRPPRAQTQPSATQAPPGAEPGEEEALEGTAFGMSETTITALSAVGLGGVIAGGVGLGLSSGGGHASPPPATPVR
jgi:FecR protein